MPSGSSERIHELIPLLEQARQTGDRLSIVTFGTRAHVEHMLSHSIETTEFTKEVIPHGSDLNDALLTSLALLDPRRPSRILVLSDGESNGGPAENAARRARDAEGSRRLPGSSRESESETSGFATFVCPILCRHVNSFSSQLSSIRIVKRRGKLVLTRNDEVIATQTPLLRTGNEPRSDFEIRSRKSGSITTKSNSRQTAIRSRRTMLERADYASAESPRFSC